MVARLGGVLTVVERPEGERVRVQPTGLLTPNLLEALQREKAGVIALLRLLQGSGLEGYAGDVLGFAGGPTTGDLLAKVERRGAEVYVRPQGDLGIRHGERVPDTLLLTLAKAHVRLLGVLEQRG